MALPQGSEDNRGQDLCAAPCPDLSNLARTQLPLKVLDGNSDAREPGVTLSVMISGAAGEIEIFLIHSNLFYVI